MNTSDLRVAIIISVADARRYRMTKPSRYPGPGRPTGGAPAAARPRRVPGPFPLMEATTSINGAGAPSRDGRAGKANQALRAA